MVSRGVITLIKVLFFLFILIMTNLSLINAAFSHREAEAAGVRGKIPGSRASSRVVP